MWPQAVAEAVVLNHMIKAEACVEKSVPVFAGDLNEHIIVHHADRQTLHVAHSSSAQDGKRIAVGCMRQLLSNGLGAPDAGPAGGHMAHCPTQIWCHTCIWGIAALLSPLGNMFVYNMCSFSCADEETGDADEPGPSGVSGGPHHGGNMEHHPPGSAGQPPSGGQGRAGMQTRSRSRSGVGN